MSTDATEGNRGGIREVPTNAIPISKRVTARVSHAPSSEDGMEFSGRLSIEHPVEDRTVDEKQLRQVVRSLKLMVEEGGEGVTPEGLLAKVYGHFADELGENILVQLDYALQVGSPLESTEYPHTISTGSYP